MGIFVALTVSTAIFAVGAILRLLEVTSNQRGPVW